MEKIHYISQWEEVKRMTDGKTMDEVRAIFGNDITNDLRESREFIDANYKDILVTIYEEDGKARLDTSVECYNKEGIFLGVIYISAEK